jgi:hypothetical protein
VAGEKIIKVKKDRIPLCMRLRKTELLAPLLGGFYKGSSPDEGKPIVFQYHWLVKSIVMYAFWSVF